MVDVANMVFSNMLRQREQKRLRDREDEDRGLEISRANQLHVEDMKDRQFDRERQAAETMGKLQETLGETPATFEQPHQQESARFGALQGRAGLAAGEREQASKRAMEELQQGGRMQLEGVQQGGESARALQQITAQRSEGANNRAAQRGLHEMDNASAERIAGMRGPASGGRGAMQLEKARQEALRVQGELSAIDDSLLRLVGNNSPANPTEREALLEQAAAHVSNKGERGIAATRNFLSTVGIGSPNAARSDIDTRITKFRNKVRSGEFGAALTALERKDAADSIPNPTDPNFRTMLNVWKEDYTRALQIAAERQAAAYGGGGGVAPLNTQNALPQGVPPGSIRISDGTRQGWLPPGEPLPPGAKEVPWP